MVVWGSGYIWLYTCSKYGSTDNEFYTMADVVTKSTLEAGARCHSMAWGLMIQDEDQMHHLSNTIWKYVERGYCWYFWGMLNSVKIYYVGKSFLHGFLFVFCIFTFQLWVYTSHWGVRDVLEILTGVAPSRPAPWRSACAGGVACYLEGRICAEHRMTKIWRDSDSDR